MLKATDRSSPGSQSRRPLRPLCRPFWKVANALHRQWHKVNPQVVRSLERSRPTKNNHLSALELLIFALRRPSLATATRPFEVCSPRYLATLPGWSAIGSDESGCSCVLSHEGTKYTNTGTKWDVVATAEQPVPFIEFKISLAGLPGCHQWMLRLGSCCCPAKGY
ncbi:hypothetical protein XPA_005421 [Xanthoria parietina]